MTSNILLYYLILNFFSIYCQIQIKCGENYFLYAPTNVEFVSHVNYYIIKTEPKEMKYPLLISDLEEDTLDLELNIYTTFIFFYNYDSIQFYWLTPIFHNHYFQFLIYDKFGNKPEEHKIGPIEIYGKILIN